MAAVTLVELELDSSAGRSAATRFVDRLPAGRPPDPWNPELVKPPRWASAFVLRRLESLRVWI